MRRAIDQLIAFVSLEEAGLKLVSLSEAWPEDAKMRRLVQAIIALFDEMYSEGLSEDATRGMKHQGSRGLWTHGYPPYGYRVEYEVEGRAGRLAQDPELWPHLERLLEMRFADADGFRKIAERMTTERRPPPCRPDLPKRSHAETWTSNHVRRILGNLVYAGDIVWHPRDPKTGKELRDPETDQPVVEVLCADAHPALLTREQWAMEQRMRREKRRGGGGPSRIRTGERGLFTPFLRCESCGGNVRIERGGGPKNRTYSYVCGRSTDNHDKCGGVSVRVDQLDPAVRRSIEDAVLTPEGTKELVRASIERLAAMPGGHRERERADLAVQEREISRRIERLTQAVELGGDLEEIAVRLKELRRQRESVRQDLAAIPGVSALPVLEDLDLEAFQKSLRTSWRSAEIVEQRRALAQILDSIGLDPKGIVTIRYAWHDPTEPYLSQSPSGPPYAPRSAGLPSGSVSPAGPASTAGLSAARR